MPPLRPAATSALSAAALLGAGFLAGQAVSVASPVAARQETPEAVQLRVKEAYDGLRRAQAALEQESLYTPVVAGVNAFTTLSGGYDVLASLEAGRGVDPETLAGLYADRALETLRPDLGRDAEGRVTYRGQVVRLLAPEVLAAMLARRSQLTGEAID